MNTREDYEDIILQKAITDTFGCPIEEAGKGTTSDLVSLAQLTKRVAMSCSDQSYFT